MQIKIFQGKQKKVEEKCNVWLKETGIFPHDIKISSSPVYENIYHQDSVSITLMVMYGNSIPMEGLNPLKERGSCNSIPMEGLNPLKERGS